MNLATFLFSIALLSNYKTGLPCSKVKVKVTYSNALRCPPIRIVTSLSTAQNASPINLRRTFSHPLNRSSSDGKVGHYQIWAAYKLQTSDTASLICKCQLTHFVEGQADATCLHSNSLLTVIATE